MKHIRLSYILLMMAAMLAVSAYPGQRTRTGRQPGNAKGTAVDLGLSVKWADHNLGAARAIDHGRYYSWGALKTQTQYIDTLCPTWNRNFDYREIAGDTLYDAATKAWGEEWRMPTSAEMQELIDSCTWKFTTIGGVDGYRVTGPSGRYIFLPAAGYKVGRSVLFNGSEGMYWSAEPIGTRLAGVVRFDKDGCSWFNFSRSTGLPIRPVAR